MSPMCWLVALGNPDFWISFILKQYGQILYYLLNTKNSITVGHHYYQECKFDSTFLLATWS